jgi:transposase-like protein
VTNPVSYKRHRNPPEVIARAVRLYFRFPLSLRLIEEMLLERGIVVTYETIRRWGQKFGPDYARRFRRKPRRPDDIWHLDEEMISIAGKKHWLWVLYFMARLLRNPHTGLLHPLPDRRHRQQGIDPATTAVALGMDGA